MKQKKPKTAVYCPVFFNLRGQRCVVVGGGKVALRKVKILLDCRAKVTVISPKPQPEVVKLAKEKAIHFIQRNYELGDIKNAMMAIASTDQEEINKKVARDAKKQGILVNVVDDQKASDFIIPSFFRRGNLTIAVSTAGMSPALARKIRTTLEKNFGKEFSILLSLVSDVRSELKMRGKKVSAEAWQETLDLDSIIELVRSGKQKEAKDILLRKLATDQDKMGWERRLE